MDFTVVLNIDDAENLFEEYHERMDYEKIRGRGIKATHKITLIKIFDRLSDKDKLKIKDAYPDVCNELDHFRI